MPVNAPVQELPGGSQSSPRSIVLFPHALGTVLEVLVVAVTLVVVVSATVEVVVVSAGAVVVVAVARQGLGSQAPAPKVMPPAALQAAWSSSSH